MDLSQLAGRRVISTHPQATVLEVCGVMLQEKVGAVVVLDEGVLVGILSERDIVRRVAAQLRDPATTLVSDVMTSKVTTVSDKGNVQTAIELMHHGNFRHLPMVDASGRVIGVLSVRDLLRQRVQELDLKNADLMNFISADGPGG
jgi:CBS domain-containing protein